jgi:hypothetical protein
MACQAEAELAKLRKAPLPAKTDALAKELAAAKQARALITEQAAGKPAATPEKTESEVVARGGAK